MPTVADLPRRQHLLDARELLPPAGVDQHAVAGQRRLLAQLGDGGVAVLGLGDQLL
jgi:hypothetical protein